MSVLVTLPLAEPWFFWVMLGTIAAGLVRGLSGFGSALVLVPILASFVGPAAAVAVINVIDPLVTAPLLPGAFR